MENEQLQPVAPVAEKIEFNHVYHGQQFNDPYNWLRDDSRKNEKMLAYLNAENAYTDSLLHHTKDMQDKLFKEMKSRIKEDDESVPVFDNGYYYYSRTEKGKQYNINCRKKSSLDAKEEVVLDENQLAEGLEYFSLGAYSISPDNNLLAYSVNTDGSESFTIFVKDLVTGEITETGIKDTYYSLEWSNDNQTFYYTKFDAAHRPYQMWKHKLGTNPSNDVLVFEELDESYFLGVGKTKDEKYILCSLGSQITSEFHFLDADDASSTLTVIAPREKGVQYGPEHYKGAFYLVTNADAALNFKLVTTPIESPGKANWVDVFPYDANKYINGFEPFKDHMVIFERLNGQRNIRVVNAETMASYDIAFDEAVYNVSLGANPTFDTKKLRINYNSLTTPNTVFDYNMDTKVFESLKVQEVPGGYDASKYESERVFATAEDGTKVPVNLVYKKGLKKDGNNPCYLYAYGSYSVNLDPWFSTARISLLDRGFIYAIANIRGGSEMGRQWYESGKFLQKKNTFTDFIAAADYLIEDNYTKANKLCASGGSAGGLLMGAVANMGADRFNTIVADVPFVDVINTMMDDTIPLTVIEYDEWGNPNEKMFFDYMLSYSPYDNVTATDYPNMLVTAGLNDPRVQYWEPAKYVAKLRDVKTDNNKLILKTNMGAGHGGASGRFDRLKEVALEYAYILDNLGID